MTHKTRFMSQDLRNSYILNKDYSTNNDNLVAKITIQLLGT